MAAPKYDLDKHEGLQIKVLKQDDSRLLGLTDLEAIDVKEGFQSRSSLNANTMFENMEKSRSFTDVKYAFGDSKLTDIANLPIPHRNQNTEMLWLQK